jgi:hypothetical protein
MYCIFYEGCTPDTAGWGDLKETVWRMLAYLFTTPCAKLVNWSGVNQKLAFKNLKLKEVLFRK